MSNTKKATKAEKGKSILRKAGENQNLRKRGRQIEDDDNGSFDMESGEQMALLLKEFGGGMEKKFQSKQKKMKQDIEASVEVSSNEIWDVFNNHLDERQKLLSDLHAKLSDMFDQEALKAQKEQEMKIQLQKAMKQREKEMIYLMAKKNEHLNAMKSTTEVFFQGIETLNQAHKQQYDDMNDEMQATMKGIQKKIHAEQHKESMTNLRKRLQSILE